MKALFSIESLPTALLSFILGITLARILPQNPQVYFCLTAVFLAAAIIVHVSDKSDLYKGNVIPRVYIKKSGFSLCILLLFLLFGITRTQQYRRIESTDISRFRMQSPVLIQGTVVNNPVEESGRALVSLEEIIEPVTVQPVTGNLLLIFKGERPPLHYGDWVRARVVVEKPSAEDGFDYPAYLARQRIYAVSYPDKAGLSIIGAKRLSAILSFSFRMRSRLNAVLKQIVPEEPQCSILEAISFGLRQPKKEVKEPFQKVGIYHLLVVSGLHVGFFLLFLHLVSSPLPVNHRLRAFLYIPAIFMYSLACGLAAPVVRAGLMAGFYCLGTVLNRPSKPIHSLSFAAFVLLLVNPFYLLEAGWQLTFGITLGLIAGINRFSGYFSRLPAWLGKSLSAAAVGQLTSLPLVAFHFGNVPVLGILANLFFVPFSALVVLQTFLTVFLGPLGRLFGPGACLLVTVFYRLTQAGSELPFTSLAVRPGNYLYFLGYLPLLAGLLSLRPKKR